MPEEHNAEEKNILLPVQVGCACGEADKVSHRVASFRSFRLKTSSKRAWRFPGLTSSLPSAPGLLHERDDRLRRALGMQDIGAVHLRPRQQRLQIFQGTVAAGLASFTFNACISAGPLL